MIRTSFFRTRLADILIEILSGNDTPSWPHPLASRWGILREDGEILVYLGPIFLIWTPAAIREPV